MTMGIYRASGSDYDSFLVERKDVESGVWEDLGSVKIDLNKTAD